MKMSNPWYYQCVSIAIMSLFLVSCNFVSSSGPSFSSIGGSKSKLKQDVAVVDVDKAVIQILQSNQKSIMALNRESVPVHNNIVGIGDVLEVNIWESPPAILFSGALDPLGSGNAFQTKLPAQMVNANGTIKVPFVGLVPAKGKTPEQIADFITQHLEKKANQPQVLVIIANNNSATVTVIKDGSSVHMPLTPRGERILDAITAIGGVESLNKTSVQLTRNNTVTALPVSEIISTPSKNVMLKKGDVISTLDQNFSFVVLGATGKNTEIDFENSGISLAQAIGRIGGINDNRANAKGVFIFRYETPYAIAQTDTEDQTKLKFKMDSVVSAPVKVTRTPIVYRFDFKDPNSMFYAQSFMMQDKDILYVANSRATELQKFLRAVFSWLTPTINTVNSIN